MFASFSIPGTDFTIASIVTVGGIPDCVPVAAAPAIRAPRCKMTMLVCLRSEFGQRSRASVRGTRIDPV